MIICLKFKQYMTIITYSMNVKEVSKMMNTMKVSKNQENLIQCALAAMELYKQALSPTYS